MAYIFLKDKFDMLNVSNFLGSHRILGLLFFVVCAPRCSVSEVVEYANFSELCLRIFLVSFLKIGLLLSNFGTIMLRFGVVVKSFFSNGAE